MPLQYIKSFLLGMTSMEEVDENLRVYEEIHRLSANGSS